MLQSLINLYLTPAKDKKKSPPQYPEKRLYKDRSYEYPLLSRDVLTF